MSGFHFGRAKKSYQAKLLTLQNIGPILACQLLLKSKGLNC